MGTETLAAGWLGWDWGNVPTWLGSVVTSTSVSIAALSYRRSVRDKEREQAGKVGAWVGLTLDGAEWTRTLRVTNASAGSIFEVRVQPNGSGEVFWEEIPAGTIFTKAMIDGQETTVTRTTTTVGFFGASLTTEIEVAREVSPLIEFRDSLGRWWARTPTGHLKAVRKSRTVRSQRRKVEIPDPIYSIINRSFPSLLPKIEEKFELQIVKRGNPEDNPAQ